MIARGGRDPVPHASGDMKTTGDESRRRESRRRELFPVDQTSTRLKVCVPREKFRMILKHVLKPCDNRSRRLAHCNWGRAKLYRRILVYVGSV